MGYNRPMIVSPQIRSKIRAIALALGLALVAPMSAAQGGENPAPVVVAQSAQNAADLGDNRPATLGDVKEVREELRETRRELRAEIREVRESLNTLWMTMVLGFVALFAVIIQGNRQARAQNNAHAAPNRGAFQPARDPA